MSLLLTYYGDDFSGSTDVLEALSLAGVPTGLFLRPPTPEDLARRPDLRAVGLAGISRSLPTERMEAELRPAFEAMGRLGAPLAHYKICSTFDSSPSVGSIGRAIEIGREVFGDGPVPLVVGAPALGRYCVFGNLFARSGLDSPVYRLDRHPTMSRHPVTPMSESDLRLHLAGQTDRRVGLFDVTQLRGVTVDADFRRLVEGGAEVALFDAVSDEDLPTVGRLVWEQASKKPAFAVGSSGLEYALAAHWRTVSVIPPEPLVPTAAPVDRLIVVSGSCSPVTGRQIEVASAHGFVDMPLPPDAWVGGEGVDQVIGASLATLSRGRSVIVHAAKGPSDPRIDAARERLPRGDSGILLGTALGRVARAAIERAGLRRVVVTGGDTSGYVARELGIETLDFVAPVAPGSPLCRVRSPDPLFDGVEVLFKGGQVGKPDLFEHIRLGTRQH